MGIPPKRKSSSQGFYKTLNIDFVDWVFGYRPNSADVNSLRDNHQSTSMEETKEPPSSVGSEPKEALHQDDQKSLLSVLEKDEETSHENEEKSLETIEYYSKTHSTVYMDQRASIDECLSCEGVAIDGCSHLYVGDIENTFEDVVARQSSHEHEDEDLVANNEEPRSNSPSPLEIQEFDQIKKK